MGHSSLRMVGHVGDVRRKERLVLLVDVDGDVGPPEEGLPKGVQLKRRTFASTKALPG